VTRLLLVRHGRSELNAAGRVQGWLDSPLDELGREQARRTARRLQSEQPQVVYTSPLRRAQETAEAVAAAFAIPLLADDRLRERDAGALAGLNSEEIEEQFPEWVQQWRASRRMIAPPAGEQPADFCARIVAAFDEIITRHLDGVATVVTHGGVLATYMGHLLGLEAGRWAPFAFGNGSLTIVDVRSDGPRIRLVNDRCHLEVEG